MKIEHLEIKNYKQFKDLTLNLTYPKGHEKEGHPLDKICIIGQSGTGKTNLLEIMKKSVINFSNQPKNSYLPFNEFNGKITDDKYITSKFILSSGDTIETLFTNNDSSISISFESEANVLENEKNYFIGVEKKSNRLKAVKNDNTITDTDKTILEGLVKERKGMKDNGMAYYGRNSFIKSIQEIDKKIKEIEERYSISASLRKLKSKNFVDHSIININEENNTWKLLKEKIDNYEKIKNDYTKKLFNKIMHEADYSKEQSIDEMKKWEKDNESILEKIAENINSIIKRFNLELQIDENTNSYDELIIKDLANGSILNYDNLSTGTKNLLSTFIPLKSYNPKDSIILIDEPENSFYPDIQRELTDLYINVGENNQLIMATHSPLIASSFEPWEIVELKFDKNNQIYREFYYPKDEENHVDNYTLDPRMLTWTSILTDIFDLKEDSSVLREQKLIEYGMLKSEIKAMTKGNERDKKIKDFKKLSIRLGLQN